MNIFVTILISGMLSTGSIPNTPGDIQSLTQSIPVLASLYTFELADNTNQFVDSAIWEQMMSNMAGSGTAEFYEVYLISGKNLSHAQKLCRIPMKDHSYSINVPPASKLVYVGKHVENGTVRYSVNGIVNKKDAWVYVSAVLSNSKVQLLAQDENRSITAVQPR